MTDLTNPIFNDEEKAREHMEGLRWPDGPVCPHCGEAKNVHRLEGKSHRKGLIQCNACLQTFTVTVGSVMERSKVPLTKWVLAFHLMAASKKGVSAHQLHRMLAVTYKTAWFMAHRVREAMRGGSLAPMGGGGGIVEIDETFISRRADAPNAHGGYAHKHAILTLVDRSGEARSFHIDRANAANIMPIVRANLASEAKVITDDAGYYRHVDREYTHAFVIHSEGQWGRGDIHTNTIEGYFSIFKRGMRGIYQHCSEQHLHRYLAEFDFRYSNRIALGIDDTARAGKAIKGAAGKRLTYQQPRKREEDQADR
jgi:transposase-like protein